MGYKKQSGFFSSFHLVEKQLRIFGVNIWDFSPLNLAKLGFIVVIVFGASFGPFIAMVSWLKNTIYCAKKRFQIMLSKPRKLMKVKQHGVSQVNPIWAKLFTLMLSCHLCQFTCISSPPKLYKYALLLFFINFFDNDDMKSLKCHDALLLLIFLLKFLCTACFQIS